MKRFLLLFVCGCVFASVHGAEQVTVTAGGNVTLQCEVPRGTKDLKLTWIKEPNVTVFIYTDGRICDNCQDPTFKHRLSNVDVKDETIIVILYNVTVPDSGKYECKVTTRGSGRRKRDLIKTTTTTIIELRVEPGETVSHNVDDVNIDGGNTVGTSRQHLGLIPFGLCVSVVVVAVAVFLITIKSRRDMMKNSHPPPDKTHDSLLS